MATSTRRVEQTNTDGSAQGNQDTSGSFIAGFKGDTGRSTSLVAELRALREGFRMAEMLQIPKLTINFDAQVTNGTVLGGEDKARDAAIHPVC
ncbi:unnamed protein product [Ilex paraguariensis]|uniref:RNase H type-1 domain-containing protein n=1 Tax=Ilex paraguariensis TaxID=185542 RepID=A0ABC8RNC2_9AQUA